MPRIQARPSHGLCWLVCCLIPRSLRIRVEMVMDSDTRISENATGASVTPEPLAQGVSVVPVEGKGFPCRGLVATRAFKVGDVLVEEAPYAAVVSLQEMESTCSGEFTPLDTAVASTCSGCKRLRQAFFHLFHLICKVYTSQALRNLPVHIRCSLPAPCRPWARWGASCSLFLDLLGKNCFSAARVRYRPRN